MRQKTRKGVFGTNATGVRIRRDARACPPRCPAASMNGLTRERRASERGTNSNSVAVRFRE
jgi:hypothetical protein